MVNSILTSFLILAFMSLFGCQINDNEVDLVLNQDSITINTYDNLKINIDYDSVSQSLWLNDSLGCHHMRGDSLLKSIMNPSRMEQIDCDSFQKVFGKPNEKKILENKEIWKYYFNSRCKGQSLIRGIDKCYIEFHFAKNRLGFYIEICE